MNDADSAKPDLVAKSGLRRRRWRWSGLSLRSRLMLMAGATILPFTLLSVFAFAALLHQQKAQTEQATLGMTRALAASVVARMQQTISALEAFSLATPIDESQEGTVATAHAASKSLRAAHPDWRGVLLARPDGTVLFASESPFGGGFRQVMEITTVAEVVRTRAPVVGPMTTGPRGGIGYTVRIPVERGGEIKYVLTAIVGTDSILEVIQRQQVPSDWVVSVFDSNLKRVARSKDHGRYFGTEPSPSLKAMLASLGSRREAVGTTSTLEGDEVYTAASRIDGTSRTMALGASTQIAEGALWRTASLYSAGLLLSLTVGALAFFLISRSITIGAAALRESAVALGLGKPLPVPTSSLPDFDAVSTALWEAGQLRAKAEEERENLLRSETGARAVAQAAEQRLLLLLAATSSLSQALDEASTLNAIASAVVPNMADICRVDLLSADGTLERKLTFHRDPTKAEKIDQIVHSGTVPATTPGSLLWVIASGREYVRHLEASSASRIEDPLFRRFVEVTEMRSVCVVPLIARGRTIGAMAAIQSSSERRFGADDVVLLCELGKRAALALDNVRLYTECTSALDRANVAGKAKDDFLAMLGHELRNPLAPILTAVEIVKRRDATVFVKEREIIERQAKQLAHLVDDLLDVSRIAAGKIHLQHSQLDLRSVVLRALETTQPLFEKRSPPVVRGAETPVFVWGDYLRLAQVVGNLLNNAAKFSEPDQPVTIELKRGAGGAVLIIEDRGTGIPDELLPHVFDRFVQSAQSLQRAKGGLGLGLAIARSIVELHGGTIEAGHGSEGRGTRMTVSLPLLARSETLRPESGIVRGGESTLRVLVVDDNTDAAHMLSTLLTLAGHQVRTAFDAESCLAIVAEVDPDACILDIGLPGMDGYELARRLRARAHARSLYLIALTGYGQQTDREQALSAGFNEHMTKPFNFEALEATLARVRPD